MSLNATFSVVASPLHSASSVQAAIEPVRQALEATGARENQPNSAQPHVYVLATGGTEELLLEQVGIRHSEVPYEPVVAVAHASQNSLASALESVARLRQLGQRAQVLFLGDTADTNPANAKASLNKIDEILTDLAAVHRFHRCRIGLIGKPSEWLVASSPSAAAVADRWGPELVEVEMVDVIGEARAVPVHLGQKVSDRFSRGPATKVLPPHGDVAAAAQIHPVLTNVSNQHSLDAVTVRCFDFLNELETSGCVALAQLNDDGFVAGCEGDVPATLALLWARYLLDQPGWIANPASIDIEANQVELAHCTIAPSMVDEFSLSTHFESGIGVGIHGHFGPGPVTLIRIGGLNLDKVWLANGSIVGSGASSELCRTQATIKVEDRSVTELLDRPLGNHLVLVAGHHGEHLTRWWEMAIAEPDI